jgi:hypothetical protein
MKQLLILCLCFACIGSSAQTKKIAFKSHSGSTENFATALENNLFDMENSNFGAAPIRDVRTAQLDSVIFISDTVAIMVTSEYCTKMDRTSQQPISDPRLWEAGRQTVFNHPLFSRKHSLDSIKSILREQYNFQNPVEKVVFVGFDNKKKKYKANTIIPVSTRNDDNNQSPFDGPFVLILSLIAVASVLAAFISWRFYQPNPAKVMSA